MILGVSEGGVYLPQSEYSGVGCIDEDFVFTIGM